MKVIFAHDHRFIPLNGQVFSESQFDSSLWNRYLKHFAQVTVTAREGFIAKDKSIEKLVVSSRDNVDFKFIPNLSSLKNQILKRNQAFQLMKQYVQDVDAIIARLPSEIGLLAIASNVAGIPELLDEKNLINPGDANQLGKILQRVADNKDWRLQEAQRNWQRAGDYAQNILEERRDKFWQSFAEYAKDFS